MRKCIECGAEIEDRVKACPNCGYEGQTLVCPECGKTVESTEAMCPSCGCPLKETTFPEATDYCPPQKQHAANKKLVGIILCLAAVFLFAWGASGVMGSKYQFYLDHYNMCEESYYEVKSEGASAKGTMFASDYAFIASMYQELMADDLAELRGCRIQAIVGCSAGAASLVCGLIVFLGRKRKNGTSDLS